jgi:demethylmenaquinone methyltransferase/2-methoxy-6-polyprenyl-1,4-benzoquinol methylase
MKTLSVPEKPQYVKSMFRRVAGHYDLMNTLMTAGQDKVWRREVIKRAGLKPGFCLLDLGSGTGDLARMVVNEKAEVKVVAADLTLEMMLVGKKRGELPFTAADAEQLPFDSNSFDVVVSGFLLRNVADLDRVLAEQFRVLKPGGRLITLDTTKPTRNLLTPFIWLHMHLIIPVLGTIISGNPEAYKYLPSSSEHFLLAEELADKIGKAGFAGVGFKRMMAGTVAIHWGGKSEK